MLAVVHISHYGELEPGLGTGTSPSYIPLCRDLYRRYSGSQRVKQLMLIAFMPNYLMFVLKLQQYAFHKNKLLILFIC